MDIKRQMKNLTLNIYESIIYIYYSYLNASIGFKLAARRAG